MTRCKKRTKSVSSERVHIDANNHYNSLLGGAKGHDMPERETNKQNNDQNQNNPEAMEIDLKCAEKVTDSDVESNADDKVSDFLRIPFLLLIHFTIFTERIVSKGSKLLHIG